MEKENLISRLKESSMKYIFMVMALASAIAIILICVFLFANGIPAIGKVGFFDFLLGKEWAPTDSPPEFGIFPMVLGSLYITAGAVIIGVPIGILTAVFMSRMCPKALYRPLKSSLQLLAGIPSVVYGFFGLLVIVPLIREYFGGTGNSILAGSVLLGIMILPTIATISETSIRAVSESYYEGALALGASNIRSIFFVVLPAAKSGIFAAIVLGLGRAVGETMAVIMVAGNQARIPSGLLDGVRTLTSNIVIEMGYASGLHKEVLIGTAVVLFVFIFLINISLFLYKRRTEV